MWGHVVISTCRRPMDTKLDKLLTYSDSISPLKPHDLLITWTCGHVEVSKTYIFTITSLMAYKPSRVLTYGRRSSMQSLKSSPTFCYKLLQAVVTNYERFITSHDKIYYILLQLKYFIKNYDTLLSCYKRLSKNYHKWRQVLQIATLLKDTT